MWVEVVSLMQEIKNNNSKSLYFVNLEEHAAKVIKVSKTKKGGRRISYGALVVVGDCRGLVGIGLGKAQGTPEAIKKGGQRARKNTQKIVLQGSSIPHEVKERFSSGYMFLKPASTGTGIIAGGISRTVLKSAGICDIVGKSLGSNNPHNLMKATFNCLVQLKEIKMD